MIPGMTAPLDGPVTMNIPFDATSAARVRDALGSWLGHRGSAPDVVEDARLVASELVGNAVRHAEPLSNGTMLVRWRETGPNLDFEVCDGGGPTEPTLVEAAPEDVGGRGLAIVEALSARWWVERASHLRRVHVQLAVD